MSHTPSDTQSDSPSAPLVEVAVALPAPGTYTYRAPEAMADWIAPGQRVLVPFGRRKVTGYVLGPGRADGSFRVKSVLDVLDDAPLFPPAMIPFFRWIADYYLHPLGEVIRNALPGGINLAEYVVLEATEAGRAAAGSRDGGSKRGADVSAEASRPLNPLEKALLGELAEPGPRRLRDLVRSLGREIPAALVHRMAAAGLLDRRREMSGGDTRTRTERYAAPVPDPPDPEGLSAARRAVFDLLAAEGEMPVRRLKERIPTAPRLVKLLAEDGFVELFEREVYRDPFGEPVEPDAPPELTSEQEIAVAEVLATLDGDFAAFLLAGVTGSGKTEVYLRLAAEALERGRTVLVLVPEIALISQMAHRFRARFGEKVALLHSGLTAGERYDQWLRIRRGDAPVVVGARSAVFAPLETPGLLVVDEEHDTSYKQGRDLLYNARDLAVVRARQTGGTVVLGSATPSVQSRYNVRCGKFRDLRLTRRVARRPMPRVTVVDLRKEPDLRGARRFISPRLHQAIRETLNRGEQVLLFLNRRGFASFPVCGDCGEALRCKSCEVTLTLHRAENRYACHYCGYARPLDARCAACDSNRIHRLGYGTERVEDAVRRLFPAARVARMDRDTTARKGSLVRLLRALRNRSVDILVGTQMVAKGHDFPGITLVGILCADLSLSFPDFRAGERTFQLLAQVAGRAGRGDVPGQVILQTFNPDHFSIAAARNQDADAFYATEIGFRSALGYPPYSRLIHLRLDGRDVDRVRSVAQALGGAFRTLQSEDAFRALEVLGPIEAPISRIAGRFRWQILLKGRKVPVLRSAVRRLMAERNDLFSPAGVRVTVDVDPFFMS
ncbi:MAG: primosomal protein N' [Desulfococcaceae bacterium]